MLCFTRWMLAFLFCSVCLDSRSWKLVFFSYGGLQYLYLTIVDPEAGNWSFSATVAFNTYISPSSIQKLSVVNHILHYQSNIQSQSVPTCHHRFSVLLAFYTMEFYIEPLLVGFALGVGLGVALAAIQLAVGSSIPSFESSKPASRTRHRARSQPAGHTSNDRSCGALHGFERPARNRNRSGRYEVHDPVHDDARRTPTTSRQLPERPQC